MLTFVLKSFLGFKKALVNFSKTHKLTNCHDIAKLFNKERKPNPKSRVAYRRVIVLG